MKDLKGATVGKALALPANITKGWRGLPGPNILAYAAHLKIIFVKSITYNIMPRIWCIWWTIEQKHASHF